MIELTQDEVKIAIAVFESVNFKLADAPKVQPILDKLKAVLEPEKPATQDAVEVK